MGNKEEKEKEKKEKKKQSEEIVCFQMWMIVRG